jgi:DNA-binding transcriptional ArsR family regulator
MMKITLDREAFKALASDTRLDILKTLDGRRLGLCDLAEGSHLNKTTLHEHLAKLQKAGLIKRTGGKNQTLVLYKLSWKASSLLHPENSRVVLLFTSTVVALGIGLVQLIQYLRGLGAEPVSDIVKNSYGDAPQMLERSSEALVATQNPITLYLAVVFFVLFTVFLCVGLWRFRVNRSPKL